MTKGNGGLVAKGAPVRLYWEAEKGGVFCDPWAAYSGGGGGESSSPGPSGRPGICDGAPMTGHKKEPRGGQGFIMKLKAAVCLALFILCNPL